MKNALQRIDELEKEKDGLIETNLLMHSQIEELMHSQIEELMHSQIEKFDATENNDKNFGKFILRSSRNSKWSKIIESSTDKDGSDHIDPENFQKLKRNRK